MLASLGSPVLLLLLLLLPLLASGGDVMPRAEAYLPDYTYYHNVTQ